MKKIILLSAIIIVAITTHAQVVYPQTGFLFYNNNNFSLNNYSPFGLPYGSPLPNRLEGYSQLNDSSCPNIPVLFSTDGINVHKGSDGTIIFTGLLGTTNSTNAATIVPISGNRALIITTKVWSSATNEAYSSIITWSGGCSAGYSFTMPLATKNLQLTSITGVTNIAEKVTVMDIPGTLDKWLLMHEATNAGGGSNKFLVFRIDYATGTINSIADYSVGLPVRKNGGKGQMQAILGQSMIGGSAYIIGAAYFIRPGSLGGATDFLYMNPSTGVVTHRETILHGFRRPYGLEHSRSSDYTYIAFRNVAQTMNRYHNYNPGGVAITVSPNTFAAPTPMRRFGQIQRTDDDAIYSPFFNSMRLFRLPLSSAAVSFPFGATNITGGSNFFFGLPNYWRN